MIERRLEITMNECKTHLILLVWGQKKKHKKSISTLKNPPALIFCAYTKICIAIFGQALLKSDL